VSYSVFILSGVISYLVGAIPFGLLIALSRGVDIRKTGSGNIGATNVFRSVGKKWGTLAFLLDMLKGFAPAFFFPIVAIHAGALPGERRLLMALVCGCAAVAGHNWPVYLRFKGGKGIATSAGVLLGMAWQAVVVGIAAWTVVFVITRYVSVASILAAATIAVAAWPLYAHQGPVLPGALTVLAIVGIWRHKINIQRLLKGTENRFEFGKKESDQ
jgi:acyl phosphate:glycerol-3-phosphate acyltransferase